LIDNRDQRPVRLAYQPPANSTFLSFFNTRKTHFSLRGEEIQQAT
jgi:hypothetical protein